MTRKKPEDAPAPEKAKKRNTISWKARAEELERLLVMACRKIANPARDTKTREAVAPTLDGELAQWWSEHQRRTKEQAEHLKQSALSKLSDAEKKALGLNG